MNTTRQLITKMQPNKKKCYSCSAKVGLFGFKCRCTGPDNEHYIYCTQCRVPKHKPTDSSGHTCTFDYKQHGKEQFEKNNPSINAKKVDVI